MLGLSRSDDSLRLARVAAKGQKGEREVTPQTSARVMEVLPQIGVGVGGEWQAQREGNAGARDAQSLPRTLPACSTVG